MSEKTWIPGVKSGSFYDDLLRSRLYSLARMLGQVAQIVSRRQDVKTKIESQGRRSPAGWNDGSTITINKDRFKDIGRMETLMRIIGTNYHEIAHLLYSPGKSDILGTWLVRPENKPLQNAWNWLEDQRIETLFTARYKRPARRYFTALVAEILVKNEDLWPTGHLLVYGRKFLPLEIRQAFRDKFEGTKDQRRRGEALIDEYRFLPVPMHGWTVNERAKEIIQEFHNLLREISGQTANDDPNDGGQPKEDTDKSHELDHAKEPQPGRGSQRNVEEDLEKAKEEEARQKEEEDAGEDGSGFWDDLDNETDPDEEEEGDDDAEEDSGRGEDSEDDDEGEPSAGSSDDSDDFGDDDGGDSQGASGAGDDDVEDDDDDSDSGEELTQGSGAGDREDGAKSDWDIPELLNEVLDAVSDSPMVLNDIRNASGAMHNPGDLSLDELSIESTVEHPPNSAVIAAATATAREFEKLQGDIQPGWKYGSDHGRLNVSRAMQNDADLDEIFDEWEEGREQDAGLELVILLDTSISMGGPKMVQAAEATWVIKKAVEELDCAVSVINFDSSTTVYYQREERVAGVRMPAALGSSTVPLSALRVARRIMTSTEKPIKMLVVVTDGSWGGPGRDIHETIESIDAYKVCVGIDLYGDDFPQSSMSHAGQFHLVQNISTADQLAPLVSQAVEHLIRTQLGR